MIKVTADKTTTAITATVMDDETSETPKKKILMLELPIATTLRSATPVNSNQLFVQIINYMMPMTDKAIQADAIPAGSKLF